MSLQLASEERVGYLLRQRQREELATQDAAAAQMADVARRMHDGDR